MLCTSLRVIRRRAISLFLIETHNMDPLPRRPPRFKAWVLSISPDSLLDQLLNCSSRAIVRYHLACLVLT